MAKRFLTFVFIAKGSSIGMVLSAIQVHRKTLDIWFSNYINEGKESLASFQYKAKKAYLEKKQIDELIKWVKKKLPGSREIIEEYIDKHFGIVYDLSSITKLLNR